MEAALYDFSEYGYEQPRHAPELVVHDLRRTRHRPRNEELSTHT
jgi:hypothetical protein